EERIKEVRVVSEAERMKQVTVLTAQAQAEEDLVVEKVRGPGRGTHQGSARGLRGRAHEAGHRADCPGPGRGRPG
ncbi:hypothetical protein CQA20_29645, partial [Klebsiella pneumoniae]